MTRTATAQQIADACGGEVLGDKSVTVDRWVALSGEPGAMRPTDITWGRDGLQMLFRPGCGIIIVGRCWPIHCTQIVVNNPRLAFARAARAYPLSSSLNGGPNIVASTAVVNGKAYIGAEGQKYEPDEDGNLVQLPSFGNVVVEDDVRVHAGAVVCRAVLGSTVLSKGVSVGCNATVGGGASIGAGSFVCAGVGIGGSTEIGKRCIVWMKATIANKVRIGDHVTVGANATICAGARIDSGVKIGDGIVVGPGEHVTRDIPRRPTNRGGATDVAGARLEDIVLDPTTCHACGSVVAGGKHGE